MSRKLSKLESVFGKEGKSIVIKIASLAVDREIKKENVDVFLEEWKSRFDPNGEYKERLRIEFNLNDRKIENSLGDYRVIIDIDGNVSMEAGTNNTLEVKNMIQIYEILLPLMSTKFKRNEVIKSLS